MPTKQKARKTYVCVICKKTIAIGEEYWKHSFLYGPTVIHCGKHPFKRAQLTRSDYLQTIYTIMDDETIAADLPSELEEVKDNYVEELGSLQEQCNDSFDNIPDSLKDADVGQLLQDRIDRIDTTISELENIDFDDVDRDTIVDENEQDSDENDDDYNDRIDDIVNEQNADRVTEIADEITDALSNLEE